MSVIAKADLFAEADKGYQAMVNLIASRSDTDDLGIRKGDPYTYLDLGWACGLRNALDIIATGKAESTGQTTSRVRTDIAEARIRLARERLARERERGWAIAGPIE